MEPAYRNFIIHDQDSVLKYWQRLGAKGWRLDVADELPDQFIREFRQVLKTVDEDAVLIGEVWEDASRKVSYGELRGYFAVMSWMRRPIILFGGSVWTLCWVAKTRLPFAKPCRAYGKIILRINFYAALNIISSHDTPRILTLLGGHEAQEDLPYSQQLKRRLTQRKEKLRWPDLRSWCCGR